MDDRINVIINDDWIPALQINESYKKLLSGGKEGDTEYLDTKLSSATWLLRGIKQRRQTLYRTMQTIVEQQEEFFRKGHGHLVPLRTAALSPEETKQICFSILTEFWWTRFP